jgi:hypothetical protein
MHKKNFVYILSLDKNPNVCKIGISKNPTQRVKNLQTGSPEKIIVFRAWSFDQMRDARKYEAIMHVALLDYKKFGEWFSVSPNQASALFMSIFQMIHDKDYEPEDFENLCKMIAHLAVERISA